MSEGVQNSRDHHPKPGFVQLPNHILEAWMVREQLHLPRHVKHDVLACPRMVCTLYVRSHTTRRATWELAELFFKPLEVFLKKLHTVHEP